MTHDGETDQKPGRWADWIIRVLAHVDEDILSRSVSRREKVASIMTISHGLHVAAMSLRQRAEELESGHE